jgi:hypothetical protein
MGLGGTPGPKIASLRQRRIDVLELLRIVEALEGNPRRVFADIIRRRQN